MRILHTADWHIGAKTDDLDRFQEQKDALKQLVNYAKSYEVDMVLIAGDIYNNIVPSAEDEELFYKTVVELSRNGDCAVVAIAGNHDDPKRLSNANIFADKFGIYLVGSIDDIMIDTTRTDTNIYATKCGKGFIEFHTKQGEDCVLALLPYPSYYRYKELRKEGENFQDKVKEWLAPGVSAFRDCVGLTQITIPSNVKTIERTAFAGCTGLTFIELPIEVEKIGANAFVDCANLESVTIPSTVTKVVYYKDPVTGQTLMKTITTEGKGSWYLVDNAEDWNNLANGTKLEDVSDPIKNAEMLKEVYANDYWYKYEETYE